MVSENDDRYSKKYTTPVVPDGYRQLDDTDWKSGFKIERISDGSILEFIPVGALRSNGTLDGKNFNEKFGRRKFDDADELGEEPIHGTMNWLWNQFQSVREYGGFYATYQISRAENLKPISIPRKQPWTMVDFERAMYLASSFESKNGLSSHLLFGAEYDSILEWQIESNKMTVSDVTVQESQVSRNICNNDIVDFRNVAVWTQEKTVKGTLAKPAVRGSTLRRDGSANPLAWRQEANKFIKRPYIGFQVALFIPIL